MSCSSASTPWPASPLAQTQQELQTRLIEITPTVSPELRRLWESAATTASDDPLEKHGKRGDFFAHEFYVLIRCRDERHQVELLEPFQAERLDCDAKLC